MIIVIVGEVLIVWLWYVVLLYLIISEIWLWLLEGYGCDLV